MAVTINGTTGITSAGGDSSAADNTINGVRVGRGAGSVATNTAVGASALNANTSGDRSTAVGYQAALTNTTGVSLTALGYNAAKTTNAKNTAVGAQTMQLNTTGNSNVAVGGGDGSVELPTFYSNTTGSNNTVVGWSALASNTTASNNTAVGYQAGYSNTANDNTAVGYQAGYSTTTGIRNAFFGYQAGYSNTTGVGGVYIGDRAGYSNTTNSYSTCVGDTAGQNATGAFNTLIGGGAGYLITTGAKNTVLGGYTGNNGGLDIRTASNNIVLSDGDGNPRLHFNYVSSTNGAWNVRSNSAGDSTNNTFIIWNGGSTSGADVIFEAGNFTTPGISGVFRVAKYSGNNRSINASGTINQNGADYAEYMHKAGDFTIAKGDLCGIDVDGKLTNVFANAVSFVVKSTDPGLVGGDKWFTEPRPVNSNGEEVPAGSPEYIAWNERMQAARATVDRIAFCGQVPVNVLGATPGQWIIPTEDNGAIKGAAVSNPTFEQYQIAVGKVIAVEADGRAKIIVKIA